MGMGHGPVWVRGLFVAIRVWRKCCLLYRTAEIVGASRRQLRRLAVFVHHRFRLQPCFMYRQVSVLGILAKPLVGRGITTDNNLEAIPFKREADRSVPLFLRGKSPCSLRQGSSIASVPFLRNRYVLINAIIICGCVFFRHKIYRCYIDINFIKLL